VSRSVRVEGKLQRVPYNNPGKGDKCFQIIPLENSSITNWGKRRSKNNK